MTTNFFYVRNSNGQPIATLQIKPSTVPYGIDVKAATYNPNDTKLGPVDNKVKAEVATLRASLKSAMSSGNLKAAEEYKDKIQKLLSNARGKSTPFSKKLGRSVASSSNRPAYTVMPETLACVGLEALTNRADTAVELLESIVPIAANRLTLEEKIYEATRLVSTLAHPRMVQN